MNVLRLNERVLHVMKLIPFLPKLVISKPITTNQKRLLIQPGSQYKLSPFVSPLSNQRYPELTNSFKTSLVFITLQFKLSRIIDTETQPISFAICRICILSVDNESLNVLMYCCLFNLTMAISEFNGVIISIVVLRSSKVIMLRPSNLEFNSERSSKVGINPPYLIFPSSLLNSMILQLSS
ncbi:hypothetical protein WICPIJ_001300 [Wickerhamomyces pijperi]|uniref:Uncharacterized protein n=1 Tax=Wickerhamomyces pijperi TaxID=599730 RepID=A0A9P8QBX5_WICPI|nr:hypothetical protein WICPIJ_001300 [Wickerhamomyces pijperi]